LVELVSLDWLAERLGSAELQVVDPRTRERYLSGHAAGSVHVPIREAFDDGRLRDPADLAGWLGSRGVDRSRPVVVYDDYDGQKGSMLTWILEWLGHPQVSLVDAPFGRAWAERGGELFYRPARPDPVEFPVELRPALRATREDVAGAAGPVVDVRGRAEFEGTDAAEGEPGGHIPGALHVDWREFVQDGDALFAPSETVRGLLAGAGGVPILYCRSGPRAAVAAQALRVAGVEARLYDGSILDWTRAGMPLEQ
jgi:thiosulfate/3-mercaptopyruvate sulfurtransferase